MWESIRHIGLAPVVGQTSNFQSATAEPASRVRRLVMRIEECIFEKDWYVRQWKLCFMRN